MKTFKKLLALLLAALLVLSLAACGGHEEGEDDDPKDGESEKKDSDKKEPKETEPEETEPEETEPEVDPWMEWTCEDGVLKITGEGEMPGKYGVDDHMPWEEENVEFTRVEINGVTSVGQQAFVSEYYLEEVYLGPSVREVGYMSFQQCEHLVSVTGCEGLETIGKQGFYGCDSLTSVSFPDTLLTIGDSGFRDCENLSVFPDGVTSVGEKAFENCAQLTSVTLGDNATVDDYAFSGCTGLKELTVGEGTVRLGSRAFMRCYDLATINIKTADLTLMLYCFSSSESIQEINFAGSEEDWEKSGANNEDLGVFPAPPKVNFNARF